MKKYIGQRIKEIMVALNISQNELSMSSGIDQGSISLYTQGKAEPSSTNLRRIAWGLGVKVDDLLPPDNDIEDSISSGFL